MSQIHNQDVRIYSLSSNRSLALEIAKYKMPDLAVYDEEAALRCVAGTAKQMGIKITGVDLSPNKTAKGAKK